MFSVFEEHIIYVPLYFICKLYNIIKNILYKFIYINLSRGRKLVHVFMPVSTIKTVIIILYSIC